MLKHSFSSNSISNITQTIQSGNMGFGPLVKQLESSFTIINKSDGEISRLLDKLANNG